MQQKLKNLEIGNGHKTKRIYNLINDRKYFEASKVLEHELQFCQKSRVMSLLGYCHYMGGNYESAASVYEELTFLYPENQSYKVIFDDVWVLAYGLNVELFVCFWGFIRDVQVSSFELLYPELSIYISSFELF